jgi:hypothetical protein
MQIGRQEAMLALDDALGYVFRYMDSTIVSGDKSLLDHTMVIFTSDNGQQMGEHNLVNKMFPYEESIRVPLIIRLPNADGTPRSRQDISTLVVNNDIAPTIAQYTATTWTNGKPDGRSLLPLIDTSLAYGRRFERKRVLIEHQAIVDNFTPWTAGSPPLRYMPHYQVPHYEALRTTIAGTGGLLENSLYARYRYDPDQYPTDVLLGRTDLTHPIGTEFIEMTDTNPAPDDANQMNPSLTPKPVYDAEIKTFLACKGAAECAVQEDGFDGVAVASQAANQLHVFVRNQSNGISYRQCTTSTSAAPTCAAWNTGLGTITALPGGVAVASDPSVVSWGPGRFDLFVRGDDNWLWHNTYTGGAWTGWETLSNASAGSISAAPAVTAVRGVSRLDVFIRGVSPVETIWHRSCLTPCRGASWSAWSSLPTLNGRSTADPAAVAWANGSSNRIHVFIRGTDNSLWSTWADTATLSWLAWTARGGGLSASPTVASWGPNRLDVFVRGTDLALWQLTSDGASTWTWQPSHGGGNASAPAAVSSTTNRIDVFARGKADNQLWQRSWNGTAWSWTAHGVMP